MLSIAQTSNAHDPEIQINNFLSWLFDIYRPVISLRLNAIDQCLTKYVST
jgi:hypothetical protein